MDVENPLAQAVREIRERVAARHPQGERSRFGITHSLPFVADRVRLKVQVEAIRQDP